uniref:Uncharacterized protein n=1 Tax=Cucumis melo TaxID=3656 RepID=A0A9I9EI41_CUCME
MCSRRTYQMVVCVMRTRWSSDKRTSAKKIDRTGGGRCKEATAA